jgi:Flp pilus assembly protein TadG
MTTGRTSQRADAGFRDRLQRSMERARARTTLRIEGCCHEEEGSTIAEMALVLPILLAVLTGIFSFGIALNQYLVLTNAVNNGARAFAMSAPADDNSISIMDSGDPCKYAASMITAASSNLNTANITYTISYTTYLGVYTSSGTTTTYTGTGSSPPSCSGLKMYQQDYVVVKAVYPVSPSLYGWANKSLNLTATSAEMVQ